MKWPEAAQVCNEQWFEDEDDYMGESAWRKMYQYARAFYDNHVFDFMLSDDGYKEEMDEELLAIRKAKMQLADQRRELNKVVRVEAREDHLMEVIEEAAAYMGELVPFISDEFSDPTLEADKEAILCFSDWHYGMITDNVWQQYNVDICKERVNEVVRRTKEYLDNNHVEKLHVVILGDLIHGACHTSCRVASEESTVMQLMHATELVAEAVYKLSKCVETVYVHCQYGNHARTIQNKDESMHQDNLEMLVPWYLQARFANTMNVFVCPPPHNEFSTFDCAGYNVCFVHGDLDKFKDLGLTANTLFMKKYGHGIDYTISGDKHHLESFEQFGIESDLVPSLCGTDEYANNKRLYSMPGQTLFVYSRKYGKEATYNIMFKEDDDDVRN